MSNSTKTGWGAPPKSAINRGRGAPPVLQQWFNKVKGRPGKWAWRQYGSKSSAAVIATKARKAGFSAAVRDERVYLCWEKSRRAA